MSFFNKRNRTKVDLINLLIYKMNNERYVVFNPFTSTNLLERRIEGF